MISSNKNSHLPEEKSLIDYLKIHNLKISKIYDNLYLGNVSDANHLNDSFSHILCCFYGNRIKLPNFSGKVFLKIELMDYHLIDCTPYLKEGVKFVKNALDKGGKVFIFCIAGKSRSASVLLLYLMMYEKMTLKQALDFLNTKRQNCIYPNTGFLYRLKLLEKEIHGNKEIKEKINLYEKAVFELLNKWQYKGKIKEDVLRKMVYNIDFTKDDCVNQFEEVICKLEKITKYESKFHNLWKSYKQGKF